MISDRMANYGESLLTCYRNMMLVRVVLIFIHNRHTYESMTILKNIKLVVYVVLKMNTLIMKYINFININFLSLKFKTST